MVELKVGSIYKGIVNTKPVIYLGYQEHEEGGWFHQFEYALKKDLPGPKGGVCGYGLNDANVKKEQFVLLKTETLLYGKNLQG